jgi:hypothetical protein
LGAKIAVEDSQWGLQQGITSIKDRICWQGRDGIEMLIAQVMYSIETQTPGTAPRRIASRRVGTAGGRGGSSIGLASTYVFTEMGRNHLRGLLN